MLTAGEIIGTSALAITILGAFAGFGSLRQQLKETSDEVKALREGLYRKDGTLIYRTADECDRQCAKCQLARDRARDDITTRLFTEITSLKKMLGKLCRRYRILELYIAKDDKNGLILKHESENDDETDIY